MRFVFKKTIQRLKTKIKRLEDMEWHSSGITGFKSKEVEEIKINVSGIASQLPELICQEE